MPRHFRKRLKSKGRIRVLNAIRIRITILSFSCVINPKKVGKANNRAAPKSGINIGCSNLEINDASQLPIL